MPATVTASGKRLVRPPVSAAVFGRGRKGDKGDKGDRGDQGPLHDLGTLDARYTTLTGAQTITGVKTFQAASPLPTIVEPNLAPPLSTWALTGTATWDAALSRVNVGHAGSGPFSLTTTVPVVAGKVYIIEFTLSTGGYTSSGQTMITTLDGTSRVTQSNGIKVTIPATTTGNATLTVTNDGVNPVVRAWSAITVKEFVEPDATVASLGPFPLRHIDTTVTPSDLNRPSIGIGKDTLRRFAPGAYSALAIGDNAMRTTTEGFGTVAVGPSSFMNLEGGGAGVAIGALASYATKYVSSSVAVGYNAGSVLKQMATVAIGSSAMASGAVGSDPRFGTVVGAVAGPSLTTGRANTFLGACAGYSDANMDTGSFTTVTATTTASGQTLIGMGARQISTVQHDDATAVGRLARVGGNKVLALGAYAQAIHDRSVALGADVVTTAVDQVHLGARIISGGGPGTGSPEGVVTGPVGSRYIDTAATNGATMWVKATGTGNTGWRVVHGDTGVRVLADTDLSNGWTTQTSRRLDIRRIGNRVEVGGYLLRTTATANVIYTLPVGFRPKRITAVGAPYTTGTPASVSTVDVTTAGVLSSYAASGSNPVYLTMSFFTDDAWPATLPGAAG